MIETLSIGPGFSAISEDCTPAVQTFDARPLEEASRDDRGRQEERESHVAERDQSEGQGVGGVVAVSLLANVVRRIRAVHEHADGQVPNLRYSFTFFRD